MVLGAPGRYENVKSVQRLKQNWTATIPAHCPPIKRVFHDRKAKQQLD